MPALHGRYDFVISSENFLHEANLILFYNKTITVVGEAVDVDDNTNKNNNDDK